MLDAIKERIWVIVGLGGAFLVLVLLPPFLPTYYVSLMTQSLIYGIVATSLDIILGYTGMPSLGHGAYFAIGAVMVKYLIGTSTMDEELGSTRSFYEDS